MLENEENRILVRLGARVLSPAEYEQVGGGFAITPVCTIDVKRHTFEGDCEPPPF